MPEKNNTSRAATVPSGDGVSAQKKVPTVTVNNTFKPAKRGERIPLKTTQAKKRVEARYTTRTKADVVNEQMADADAHATTIKKGRDSVYFWIKAFKVVLALAMVCGGAAFVMGWEPQTGVAISDSVRIMSAIVFCLGPLIALFLDHHLEQGVFLGVSKLIAWGVVWMVVAEEVMALRAGRDPAFADWLMIQVGPISLGLMVGALILLGYLRSDLKRKRDLMHMKQREENTTAKNATRARNLQAKNESREMAMVEMGTFFTDKFQKLLGTPVIIIASLCRAVQNLWNDTWKATDIKAAAKGKRTTTKRTKK